MDRLEGKTALVTGAASGIGLQTSIRLAEEGARVMMTDINIEEGLQQAEKLGANAPFLKLDITEEEEWIPVLDETCLLYTSPSPRDLSSSRMPSSA